MRKILLFIFLIPLTLNAQIRSGVVASQRVVAASEETVVTTDDFEAYSAGQVLAGQGDWIQGQGDFYTRASGEDIRVISNTAFTHCVVKNNNTYANDQYAEVTISLVGAGSVSIGCGVRLTGATATLDGYICEAVSNGVTVYRLDDGVVTDIGNNIGSGTIANSDVLKMTVEGTSIKVYLNGSLITDLGTGGTITDATYASGVAGMAGYGDAETANITSFEGGDL